MRYRPILLAFAVILISSNVLVCAQTPDAAIYSYQRGTKKLEQGDLEGAIEQYTRAIEISSHLISTKRARGAWENANKFDSAVESDRLTVIDPFTARAYTNRGVARYHQDDFDGAVGDFDRAIRINPGLAEAYVNRGAARRARGDLQGALADYDRALAIKSDLF